MPVVVGVLASCAPHSAAQLTVFDPVELQQNLLSAARALEQINNQVRQLQNQALMLLRMDQNLVRLGSTISPDLQRTLADHPDPAPRRRRHRAAPAGNAKRLRAAVPADRPPPRSHPDDALRNAKARWDEEYAAFRRAALLQGQIADGIDTDTRLLADAMARSRDAVGALEAAQAGNELTALSVKQSLALQSLLAAQHRAETIARARDLASRGRSQASASRSFLGNGQAYTASR